jgi:hypothetical protein
VITNELIKIPQYLPFVSNINQKMSTFDSTEEGLEGGGN